MINKIIHKGVRARIVKRTGYSSTDKVLFEAICNRLLCSETLAEIQTKLGYHPWAYTMSGAWRTSREDGTVIYEWTCRASCD